MKEILEATRQVSRQVSSVDVTVSGIVERLDRVGIEKIPLLEQEIAQLKTTVGKLEEKDEKHSTQINSINVKIAAASVFSGAAGLGGGLLF